jgi:predicted DNA-binding transcriptional regulator AlpA
MKTSGARGEVTGKSGTSGGLMTQRAVAEFFGGVSLMTIWRWRHDPVMAFPKPVKINGRQYFPRDEIASYRVPETKAPQVKRVAPSKKLAAVTNA